MTPSERAAMQAALELLESAHVATNLVWKRHECCDQLRAALAQQESAEPFCYLYRDHDGRLKIAQTDPPPAGSFEVYTNPTD